MADRKTVNLTAEEFLEMRRFVNFGNRMTLHRDGIDIVLNAPAVPGDASLTAGAVSAERIASNTLTANKIKGPW